MILPTVTLLWLQVTLAGANEWKLKNRFVKIDSNGERHVRSLLQGRSWQLCHYLESEEETRPLVNLSKAARLPRRDNDSYTLAITEVNYKLLS